MAKSREKKAKDEGIYQVNVRVNEDAEKHIRAIAEACQEGHRWPLPPWAEDDIVTRIGLAVLGLTGVRNWLVMRLIGRQVMGKA